MRKYDFVEWRDIPGLEGRYQVSEYGYLRSLKSKTHPGGIRTQWYNKAGYATVCYKLDGKNKNILVHRAVAQAFIPNPDNKPVVNHIDSNPKNNHYRNLEWVTQGENVEHSRVHGRASRYLRAKIDLNQVANIRHLKGELPASTISKLYGITPHSVRNIWRRKTYVNI